MRLVVVTPHFAPDVAPTGEVVTRITEELAAQDHSIEVITSLPWYREHRIEPGFEGKLVRYEVPLRHDKNWLFQADKVKVVVTVNKQTRALEHLDASVREPVKVLLGLAKITAGKLDLSFLNFEEDATPGPESAQPTGSARVSVYRFGERVEFTWSDFKRVSHVAAADANLRQAMPLFRQP